MLLSLFKYYIPYKRHLTLAIVFNILTSILTVASIPALIPFLILLFQSNEIDFSKLNAPPPLQSYWDTAGWEAQAKYQLASWMQAYGTSGAMWRICAIIIAIFFLKNLFRYLSLFFLAPMRNHIVRDFRQKILQKMLALPLSYYTEERKGDLMSRLTSDVMEIEWSILGVLEAVFREPLLILGSLIFMIVISPSLTFFVFILILCTGLIIGLLGKNLKKDSGQAQARLGTLVSIIDETLSGLRIIKGFNAEKYQDARFRQENTSYANLLTKLMRRRDLASPLSEFLGIVIVCILLIYGSSKVFGGEMSSEVFFVFLYAFFNVIEPSKSFSNAIYSIRKGLGALERVEQVLHAPDRITEVAVAQNIDHLNQSIQFKNLSFTYQNAPKPAIQGVTFEIKKGEMVALVGPSGAGKSTIADLLPRFHDAQEGQITIDGIDIKSLKVNRLRNLFGIVSQEAILFNDSIKNNLTLGMPEVTDQAVIEALKAANAWEFVQQLPEGIHTNIGDRGSKLSGGQRQRLTIGRALLRNPEVLILDEATSALDSESEQLVQQAFDRLLQGRTALVISHRLSTILHADTIIVMDQGRVVASGTHDALIASNPLYAKLVELQSL
jgi:ABC-type multidrug transport system fused ATPase/permease subunit